MDVCAPDVDKVNCSPVAGGVASAPESRDMPSAADREKAKQIIRAIVEESGGALFGKLRLFKAFYAAHLFHWQRREGALSDYPIVHLPLGPAIDDAKWLLDDLVKDGIIHVGTRPNGPFIEQVFTLCGGETAELTAPERESIKEAVEWIGGKTATELSDITHENSRSWNETVNGQVMNIYLDLLNETEYEELKARQEQAKELTDAIFGRENLRSPSKGTS